MSGSAIKTWCDGLNEQSFLGTRSSWNFTGPQYLARGDANTGTTVWNISIREIIAISFALSDSDRQLIEGYLAHKWGTTNSLPSDHPYKSAAP